jgi:hypothetical protein
MIMGGCANLTSPARMHEMKPATPYWLDYDAGRRGAIVVPEGAKVSVCAEPSPDVALTFVSQILAQVKVNNGNGTPVDATVQAPLNASIVELAGQVANCHVLEREPL